MGRLLSAFAGVLDTALTGYIPSPTITFIDDASNDTDGSTINEIPHMIHFDHVNYYDYNDFSASPTKLNTAKTMDSYSSNYFNW